MDKLKSLLASFQLLVDVLECIPEDGCPESTIYIGLGSDYHLSMNVLDTLKRSNGIVIKNHWITRGSEYSKNISNAKAYLATVKAKLGGHNE